MGQRAWYQGASLRGLPWGGRRVVCGSACCPPLRGAWHMEPLGA